MKMTTTKTSLNKMLTSESSSPYPEYNHKLQKDNVFLDTPEVTEPIWLEPKRGSIPRWINGIMYRTGKIMMALWVYIFHSRMITRPCQV